MATQVVAYEAHGYERAFDIHRFVGCTWVRRLIHLSDGNTDSAAQP